MDRLLPALVLLAVAVAVAVVLQRRRPDAPVRASGDMPVQVDRSDFVRSDAPWLVLLFSSATCDACAAVWPRVQMLEAPEVAVQNVEYRAERALHDRYRIDTVPMVLVVDHEGVVRHGHTGPINSVDLWGAVADLREGREPSGGCHD